jgi:His/Glu/Gln/Arg/opine family amino acid ABC transporter permease subunit
MIGRIAHIVLTLLGGYPVSANLMGPGYPQLIQEIGGLALTLFITAVGLMAGFALALLLLACRQNRLTAARDPGEQLLGRALSGIATALVECIRGLPIIVLILIVFNLSYPLTGLRLPGVLLAAVTFGMYAASYLEETLRAGLRAVDPNLRAAGRTLGLTRLQTFQRIELPLIVRTMRPDLINIAITVFKDTSALAVVAVAELTYTGQEMVMSQPASYPLVLGIVLFLYWVPATAFSALAWRAEQRRTRIEGFALEHVTDQTIGVKQ